MCFCVFVNLNVVNLDVDGILAYMECLNANHVCVNMIANHLAKIKAKLVVLGLNPTPLDHKKIKYFKDLRSLKLNRSIVLPVITSSLLTCY